MAQRDQDNIKFHVITDSTAKIQFVLDCAQRDVNAEVKRRLVLAKVSETERMSLFKTIRWSFISHDELLQFAMDQALDLAKPLILEGLSSRLVNFEKTTQSVQLLKVKPRTNQS